MKNKSTKNIDTNILTLKFFCAMLQDCEHFVFFGTMLGLVRDGHPIENDDDVDFYVNKKDRSKVLNILKNLKIKIDFSKNPNNTEYFNQVEFLQNGKKLRADFYFYDSELDDNYILEKWNFEAKPNKIEKILKIPKVFIYPIKAHDFLNMKVLMPNQPEVLCEFLYGSKWREPLKKHTEYTIQVMGGKPFLFIKVGIDGRQLQILP